MRKVVILVVVTVPLKLLILGIHRVLWYYHRIGGVSGNVL